jgi:hypothetical protein
MTDEQLAEELEHGARRGRLSNAFILRSAARRIRELSALRKPEREVVGWRVRVYGHDPDVEPYEPWQHIEPSRDYAEDVRLRYRIGPDAWRKAVLVRITRPKRAEVGR